MTLREVYAARADNRRKMQTAGPAVREIREKLAALYDDLIIAMYAEART